jgi:hypothetical protein
MAYQINRFGFIYGEVNDAKKPTPEKDDTEEESNEDKNAKYFSVYGNV